MGKISEEENTRIQRKIESIKINGTEKRYVPNKHYVFILQVKCTDNSKYIIYRRYSAFHEFHNELCEIFRIEAGALCSEDKIIPDLPSRLILKRAEHAATERRDTLTAYCIQLLHLPDKIVTSSVFNEFFMPTPEDIHPAPNRCEKPQRSGLLSALSLFGIFKRKSNESLNISKSRSTENLNISDPVNFDRYRAIADYKSTDSGELTLTAGQELEIVEKHDNGWWFVMIGEKTGWAPATYLEAVEAKMEDEDEPPPDFTGETFITTEAFKASREDEVSFPAGATIKVMHKLLDGWWIISYNDTVGFGPATFLVPYHNPHLKHTVRRKSTYVPRRRGNPRKSLDVYRKMSDTNRRLMKTGKVPAAVHNQRGESGDYLPMTGLDSYIQPQTATSETDPFYVNPVVNRISCETSPIGTDGRTHEETAKNSIPVMNAELSQTVPPPVAHLDEAVAPPQPHLVNRPTYVNLDKN